MLKHREIKYTINYLDNSGKKRGEEPCFVTLHSDGTRVIRATSKIYDTEIIRDVVYNVDAKFKPIDCFIKIRKSEQIISTSFFTFTENNIYLKGINSENKIVNETLETNRAESFISHAVAADVWHSANIIKKKSKGIQKIFPIYSSSNLPNGASESKIHRWDLKAKFIKFTEIRTPAGIFEAEHIRYYEEDDSLWLEMWCTNDIDRIMLKMYYPVYDSYYLLNKLERV